MLSALQPSLAAFLLPRHLHSPCTSPHCCTLLLPCAPLQLPALPGMYTSLAQLSTAYQEHPSSLPHPEAPITLAMQPKRCEHAVCLPCMQTAARAGFVCMAPGTPPGTRAAPVSRCQGVGHTSCTVGGAACGVRSASPSEQGGGLDLHRGPEGQALDGKGGARRRVLREEAAVNGVDRGKVLHVRLQVGGWVAAWTS